MSKTAEKARKLALKRQLAEICKAHKVTQRDLLEMIFRDHSVQYESATQPSCAKPVIIRDELTDDSVQFNFNCAGRLDGLEFDVDSGEDSYWDDKDSLGDDLEDVPDDVDPSP